VIATPSTPAPPLSKSFSLFAWSTLAYNILVILWGSLVRATGSGAGCGQHWPLCNGEVLPVFPQAHMAIEFTHRATSGIALFSVIALYFWARRCFPRRTSARRAAFFSLIFMLNETLVGALLVLLGLVAGNRSPWRAAVLGLHLINTLLLLGALTLTAWWSTREEPRQWNQGPLKRLILAGIVLVIALSAAGGVAALGDTLFPAPSVSAGVQHEFSRSAPILVQLRVVHPVLAVLAGAYLLWLVSHSLARVKSAAAERWGYAAALFVLIQFVLGAMNILLLTPLWTQLTHLLITDLLWVSLVIFSVSILTAVPRQAAA